MSKIYFTKEQVDELDMFFNKYAPTSDIIHFGSYATITDQKLFIKSHLAVIKNNLGKRIAFSYFNRLRAFKKRIENK